MHASSMNTSVAQILERKGTDVFAIEPDKAVIDAIKLMSVKGVGAVLVTRGDELCGILSERDYARRVILEDRSSRTTRVEEIMTKKVLYVEPQQTADDCMRLMTQRHIRHLPVLEGGKIKGIVSIGDVVNAVLSNHESTIEALERYVQGY